MPSIAAREHSEPARALCNLFVRKRKKKLIRLFHIPHEAWGGRTPSDAVSCWRNDSRSVSVQLLPSSTVLRRIIIAHAAPTCATAEAASVSSYPLVLVL
jgi:hypothetical protein